MESYLYLGLDAFTLLGPLALSFDRKVHFYTRWKALLPAILFTAALFIVWDIWFTAIGVWGFNETYLVGPHLWGLPLEEWLFFIVVPYACMFVYEVLNAYFPLPEEDRWSRPLTLGLAVMLLVCGVVMHERWYTFVTFSGTSVLLFLQVFVWERRYLGRFWRGYAVSLLPFLLINGVLTSLPVVWYNDAENLGIRLVTIPIEDSIYLVWLLLMTTHLYERTQARLRQTTQPGVGFKQVT